MSVPSKPGAETSKGIRLRILISRFLTRSGDQAWDFAVPIVLLGIFPGRLQIAATYYFLIRLVFVLVFPYLASFIDRVRRPTAVKIGIGLQAIAVCAGAAVVSILQSTGAPIGGLTWVAIFSTLVLTGLLSNIGGSFMDIAIANDLVPSTLRPEELSSFNSRLRQLDLFAEVASPVIAGALLLLKTPEYPLLGFWCIAAWNILSFFPEYGFLRAIFRLRPDLINKAIATSQVAKQSIWTKLVVGWKGFFREPVATAVACYSILWLSVLSPHGVILTGFLKDGWKLPELSIGIFRGAGALFGILATFIYPRAEAKLGLVRGTRSFILFQAAMVTSALVCFHVGQGNIAWAQIGFLVFILFSRVGLYGFSLGEMQIRQIGISEENRGAVNGFASALTGIATIALYGGGALLPATSDFVVLVGVSTAAVLTAALIFTFWSVKKGRAVFE